MADIKEIKTRKKQPKKRGRKTLLTPELFKQIKRLVLKGANSTMICDILKLNLDVFYVWHSDNYLGLADKLELWNHEYILSLADKNIKHFLNLDDIGEFVTKDGDVVNAESPAKMKLRSDMTQFVSETLGKNRGFSKRIESTGANGGAIQTENKHSLDFKDKTNDELQSIIDQSTEGIES